MRVRDVMTTEVVTVKKDTPFTKIVNLLTEHRISGVPVVDDDDHVMGVISEKDLLIHLFPRDEAIHQNPQRYYDPNLERDEARKLKKLLAHDFMSHKVVTVSPDEPVLGACALMLSRNIRRLPVVENGKIIGIVTTNDIYKKCLLL